MFYTYYKAEGFDRTGFPCAVYFRTKRPVRSAKALTNRLYCDETGNIITHVYSPRLRYVIAYAWYTLKGRNVAPEDWCADAVSTITL